MKTLNINAQAGFSTEIEAIQFWKQTQPAMFDAETGYETEEYVSYSANIAVKCGDSGIVLICLSGDENEARAEWPQDTLWSKEDEAFQIYVESEFTANEFLKCLQEDNGLENNLFFLEEHGESMN